MAETKLDLSKVKPKKTQETVTKLDLSAKNVDDKVEEVKLQEVVEVEKKEVETTESEKSIIEIGEKMDFVSPVEVTDDKVSLSLPAGVDKLVEFINETGGDLNDYLRLNADYSTVDEKTLLKEYYKKIKPHLDNEELDFIIDENFSYDEDIDDERDIKLKKLAKKEEVSKARSFLDDLKGKYYEEIKSRPTLSNEQKKATDFFNRYKEGQQKAEENSKLFQSKTKNFFQNEFKGFDFDFGEKKFRYGVSNTDSIAESQSNIDNILGKFLDEKGNIKNFSEYHKAMYAAQNVDKIVSHFYDQGKADAVKEVVSNSKNITNDAPRQTSNDSLFINGLKVKAVNGVDTSRLKINKKPKN